MSEPPLLSIISLFLSLLSDLSSSSPPSGQSQIRASPYPDCPRQRLTQQPRDRICSTVQECQTECEETECVTKYQYKCTDYKRRQCEDRWQNLCTGRRRAGRSLFGRSKTVYDTASPLPSSDLPLFTPAQGQTYRLASPPTSRKCWRQVRECRWVKYKTTCGSVPVKTCQPVCQQVCQAVYYCSNCPAKPVGPAGPPAIPPPGTFIISPPAPPDRLQAVEIIDARNTRGRERIVP